MLILKSSEDYLEAMLMMRERHGTIRSIDIAVELGVTKPSVSYTTKRLRENGCITMDSDSAITLTDKSLEIWNHRRGVGIYADDGAGRGIGVRA